MQFDFELDGLTVIPLSPLSSLADSFFAFLFVFPVVEFVGRRFLFSFRFRHVPKAIKKATDAKREASSREKHKMENKRAHAKPGAIPHVNTREHAIVRELE